jgi:hypothetical protein
MVAMTSPDHHLDMLNAAEALIDAPDTRADLKTLLRRSVLLAALENVAKLETDPSLKAACRTRFLELTDGVSNDNG